MRIPDKLLASIIENEGTVDGVNPPNAAGVLRLALDLREARAAAAGAHPPPARNLNSDQGVIDAVMDITEAVRNTGACCHEYGIYLLLLTAYNINAICVEEGADDMYAPMLYCATNLGLVHEHVVAREQPATKGKSKRKNKHPKGVH